MELLSFQNDNVLNKVYLSKKIGGFLLKQLPPFLFTLSFLFLFSNIGFSQNHYFQVQAEDAITILEKLGEKYKIQFNFSHDHLPKGKFTFSCSGNLEAILKTTFTVLDRNYSILDEAVYTVQPIPFETSKSKKPLKIEGWIKNEFGQPIGGATINVLSLEKVTVSDKQGRFMLKGYYDARELVEIRYLGYTSIVISIADFLKNPNPTIYLKIKAHKLNDIEINDQISWRSQNSTNTDEIRTSKMAAVAGRTDKDVLTIVQLLPGVSTASENLSEIQIRGGLPDQTKYEWNGIQLFQTSHFFGKVSSANPFMVDKITVSKNGNSAKDAGQISGTISLSETEEIDSIEAKAYVDLLYANVGVKAPFLDKKIQVKAAFRLSYFGLYRSSVFDKFFANTFQFGRISDEQYLQGLPGAEVKLIPDIHFRDFSISTKWQASPRDEFKVSLLSFKNALSYRKLTENVSYVSIDKMNLQNQGVNASYTRRWSDISTSQLSWSKSSYENDYSYLERPDSIAIGAEDHYYNTIDQSVFQFSNSYHLKKVQLNFGYQLEHWAFESYYASRDQSITNVFYDEKADSREHSLFGQALFTPNSYWQIETGLRWSKYNRTDRKLIEPRLHISFYPNPSWTLHSHFGMSHQNLNQINVFTPLSVEPRFWYLASEEDPLFNPTPIAQNRQWSLGARYHKMNWSLAFDFYKKNITNINTSAFDFTFEEDPYMLAEMESKGVEIAFHLDKKWYSLFWTYEYAKDQFFIPDLETSYSSPYTQPHKLSFFQSIKWKKWEAALHWKFATGRPYSKPSDLETYSDEFGILRYRLLYDELLTEQESVYHTMDFTVQYLVGDPNLSKFYGKLGLSVMNLYNRRNVVKNFYYVDYREMPVAPNLLARKGLPFTPNVSLSFYF